MPQLLSAAVEANAERPALRCAGKLLTYAELDSRSSRLARALIARGLGPEDRVVVALPRSIDSVVAIWAVAKCGAAYVPVDPSYPADRVRHMLTDSGAAVGITLMEWRGALGAGLEWFELDAPARVDELARAADHPVSYLERVRELHGDHAAYVIYTSGSTGIPKGVIVTHTGLAGLCAEAVRRFGLTRDARTLHFASPSFDAAILELLLAAGAGATMVIAPPGIYGGDELLGLLREERVTHAFTTPAALCGTDPVALPELRALLVGGEACPAELVARWSADHALFNLYGPTETTVAVAMSDPLTAGAAITVGPPVPGVTALVLDARLRPVPDGASGELYLAGAALARGYHDRPGLTACSFVALPGGDGQRMYRTGDVVRWIVGVTGHRELEYLGRNDSQVKIRGFRVELGEIDAVLAADESVSFVATTIRRLPNGEAAPASYVLAETGATIDVSALRERARRALPRHAVPAAIVVIDRIPLTPAGKLDRAALPEPRLEVREFREPVGATERVIAAEFAQLLGIDRSSSQRLVGGTDDFFELGGNSLVAMRLTARLSATFGFRVPVDLVFDHPTVAGLAAAVTADPGDTAVRYHDRPALTPRTRGDRDPLSPAQQRMWFLARLDPGSAAQHISIALRLSGVLDVAALGAAVGDLCERHEVLRTVYPEIDGVGYQRVLPLERVRFSPVPQAITESDLPGELIALVSAGFDVTRDVPLRIGLFRLADAEHVLAVVVHHIAADGFSLAPLTRDLAVAYGARSHAQAPAWTPLPVQYADYAIWQRESLGSREDPDSLLSRQLRYWRETLAGLPPLLELPTDRPRPQALGTRGATYGFEVDARLRDALERLARDRGASLFMVVHAALAVVLARLSRTGDVAVGTPLAGRGERQLDDLIGMFVNTLVLRTGVDGSEPFARLLDRVRSTDLDAFAHADVPFESLVEELDPPRTEAHHPLVQVLLTFQNLGEQALRLPDLTIAGVDLADEIAEFDLELTVVEGGAGDGLHCAWRYATELFDESTIAVLAERMVRVLAAAAADPQRPVGDLPLSASTEPAAVTTGSSLSLEAPETLLEPFHAQAARTPFAVAVVGEDRSWTYAEFASWVNSLARELISAGVGPETRVAVAIRRSPEMLAAIYAVLTAGGAYTPIDPGHPADRIAHMIDTIRPACVLTSGAEAVESDPTVPRLRIDGLEAQGNGALSAHAATPITDAERIAPLRSSNAAYVLFTSGSTGRPKGVTITHAAVANLICWMREHYGLGPGDAVLHKTPVTFDASVWELFLPLQIGAPLVIARPDGHLDPDYLMATVRRHGVTILDFVPSMLALLLEDEQVELPTGVRYLAVGGEELPPHVVERLRKRHPAIMDNQYGPTEATVISTFHRCADAYHERVPIGRAVPNTAAYVLDSRLHPVPAGVAGELYLAGRQLARGYEAASGETASRLIADPFGPAGSRMYRTGDLARMRTDGVLEFLGRTDFQLSLHGLRIEPGEVESALCEHPAVAHAAVVVRRAQLIGYVTPVAGGVVDTGAVLALARDRLPGFMVPAQLVVLDAFPLGTSGKLDRSALPEPTSSPREFEAPITADEHAVAAVFAAVLGLERVGRTDDFFALGGTSLTAIRVRAALSERLESDVPLRHLFRHPRVDELAAALRDEPAPPADHPDPRADALLDPAVTAAGCAPVRPGEPAAVLLTGATGFLGVFLLRELLERTTATVHCLVRAESPTAARARILAAATAYRIDLAPYTERIVAVPGDLAAPRLGLDAGRHADLAQRVDAIYHNGALVNHLEPYERMRAANVGGTVSILRLATTTRLKPVHYVSTASLPDLETDPPADLPGYVQTKWVAERLVTAAAERGIPTAVYRPGLITGDTRTGAGSPDAWWTMLRAMLILGLAPDLGDIEVEMVPVDHVAAAITGLSRHSRPGVFDLSRPATVSLRKLLEQIQSRGYRVEVVDPERFGKELATAAEQRAAAGDHTLSRAAALAINYAGGLASAPCTLDSLATAAQLDRIGIRCPAVDAAVLDRYLEYFVGTGYFPPAR
ncbi:non-ribosomal peptide synthetase [Nocardia terrae]|uniref:non-ribosomal peptide synthetase n=1 Tax=Nocardia terrae TaxID=2675851 RepID=UPI0018E0020A|nr:non-ribosomal peptide synthetase [Nocardia terrae]